MRGELGRGYEAMRRGVKSSWMRDFFRRFQEFMRLLYVDPPSS